MTTHDFIFAGAGLAGLSLAVELARRPAFRSRRILLIDRDDKTRNDRTWCFWASDNEPLPPVTNRTWDRCFFFGADFSTTFDLAPYRYRMVRGAEFYAWAKRELAACPNVEWRHTPITGIDAANGVVHTAAGEFSGEWIFNSAFTPVALMPRDFPPFPAPFSVATGASSRKNALFLLQHFKGWVVKTPVPVFDPAVATFMDFRIEQQGETRFVYVLPFADNRALVEFTVFSPALLPQERYDEALRQYLHHHLNVEDFEIEETEFGIIPMTNFPFPDRPDGRVIHIGTAGGFVKASSGYAFLRTQRRVRAFADAWEATGRPDPGVFASTPLFRRLDSIFLRVLAEPGAPGRETFTSLFRKLPAALVLRFLDEDASLTDVLRVVSAPPTGPFLRAAGKEIGAGR